MPSSLSSLFHFENDSITIIKIMITITKSLIIMIIIIIITITTMTKSVLVWPLPCRKYSPPTEAEFFKGIVLQLVIEALKPPQGTNIEVEKRVCKIDSMLIRDEKSVFEASSVPLQGNLL